ncbi:hypothetical protein [Actinokineospora sp. UTMC 2448]|uniref:hypothetical protein n=1 Tax=Actinokineospora sp. UTMC 2448 TaxID=2268449 RepID=UPI002164B97E|nr:hypothetical protein [Actinokineospora sp. UTMC 2448]UVS77511.1 hypothetical protein Actkin_01222 [Actinokineospora sp. UTMC 2448]
MHDDPRKTYSINPDQMEDAIKSWLDPVVERLSVNSKAYTEAHAQVTAGHRSMGGGWCGGQGNGDLLAASGSFLNEVEWQLGRLSDEQAELAIALREYADLLRKHIAWARKTDADAAESFLAIGRTMDGQG